MEQIEKCIKMGIKKIVVAHGTDTMTYSAKAVSLYYSRRGAKICFAGAFYPPSHPKSDAPLNLEAAIHAVNSNDLQDGVYVAFRRTRNRASIMRAQDMWPMAPDKTYFETLYGETAGTYVPGRGLKINKLKGKLLCVEGSAPLPRALVKPRRKIIQFQCYPGMSLDDLRLKLEPEDANLVILDAYHSGTMPAVKFQKELRKLKKDHPRTHVVLAMHPFQYVTSPYETTANLAKSGLLKVYKDLLPQQVYALAICETAKGRSIQGVLNLLEPWLFGAPPKRAPAYVSVEKAIQKALAEGCSDPKDSPTLLTAVADSVETITDKLAFGDRDRGVSDMARTIGEVMRGMRAEAFKNWDPI
jgi:L-asparaginase/Glu-tRNA(Gln) amidotransferase subunit D